MAGTPNSNSSSLAVSPTSAVTSSMKSWAPQSHAWGLQSSSKLLMLTFWGLPWVTNALNGIWSGKPSRFSVAFAQIHERSHCPRQLQAYKMYSLNNETWIPPRPWGADECSVNRHENDNLLVQLHQGSWVTGALSMNRTILKGRLFCPHWKSIVCCSHLLESYRQDLPGNLLHSFCTSSSCFTFHFHVTESASSQPLWTSLYCLQTLLLQLPRKP